MKIKVDGNINNETKFMFKHNLTEIKRNFNLLKQYLIKRQKTSNTK